MGKVPLCIGFLTVDLGRLTSKCLSSFFSPNWETSVEYHREDGVLEPASSVPEVPFVEVRAFDAGNVRFQEDNFVSTQVLVFC